MRRRWLLASAAVLALLLSGCVSIPSSGKVQQGDPAPTDASSLDLDIIVDSPKVDGTQREILDGFLTAALSPRNNYQTAYTFLTPTFAEEWRADGGTTVDVFADREFDEVSDTQIDMTATPAASLRNNGQYEVATSATPLQLKYSFEQVDGQWRISSAPQGIVIDQANFSQVFREYTLYFFDPTYRYLVPDSRWFAGRDSAQTSVVQALLGGPAEWLDPGVETAFPEGTELSPAAVPVSSRVAEVSLTGAAFDDLSAAQRMQLQLDESLIGSVRNVGKVELILNGVESDAGEPSNPAVRDPRVDPRPVVFDGEALGYLSSSGDGITPIDGLSEQVVQAGAVGAAIGPDAESAAILTSDGVSVLTVGEDPRPLDPRAGLITPAYDRAGIIWTVPADSPSDLAWFSSDGRLNGRVEVPWSGTSIAAIEVSRDGTRLLALLADGTGTSFVVAAIHRDADGSPIELGSTVLRLASVDGVPLDVAWVDGRTVASLTRTGGDATRIVTQFLGGVASTRDGPEGGAQLDAANSVRDVRVRLGSGDLVVQSGVGWQPRATGIRFVAAQLPG
ncbi:Lipoprotein LpqB beta-propeller domain-containing protein [Agromyces sp. CF514]|uniref:GerMN domain-containing protein n=1 Tax=Agromyces sp. CF514 TaxID=1881031 RepID=UPI0008E036C6|nr:GerMN domain-containing protein [Agromyces sp. CF514]SFR86658.1 Lipoprotein LpqB beta-propeller domain-containing protein [Agromyces sp. CF514]